MDTKYNEKLKHIKKSDMNEKIMKIWNIRRRIDFMKKMEISFRASVVRSWKFCSSEECNGIYRTP